MSIHISAKAGEIASTVLMPGDPLRAKFIANTFLEDVICFNEVRGMLGFTGYYGEKQISVMGSGMGIPTLSIYVQRAGKRIWRSIDNPGWNMRRSPGRSTDRRSCAGDDSFNRFKYQQTSF